MAHYWLNSDEVDGTVINQPPVGPTATNIIRSMSATINHHNINGSVRLTKNAHKYLGDKDKWIYLQPTWDGPVFRVRYQYTTDQRGHLCTLEDGWGRVVRDCDINVNDELTFIRHPNDHNTLLMSVYNEEDDE